MNDGPGGGEFSAPPPRPGRGQHAREPVGLFTVARVIAAACVLVGVGLMTYTAYRIWDPGARSAQRQMTAQLHTQWSEQSRPRGAVPVRVRLGQPFAVMRIPKFGRHWEFAIVEGTSLPQLAEGPGHVPGTALPGTPGNFAVAAHDITAGNPFMHLASLRRGDLIVVQIAGSTYRYAVRSEAVVRYTDTAVLLPVPGHPGARPTAQYITLITCTPVTLGFTPWRIVVTGALLPPSRHPAVTGRSAGRAAAASPAPASCSAARGRARRGRECRAAG